MTHHRRSIRQLQSHLCLLLILGATLQSHAFVTHRPRSTDAPFRAVQQTARRESSSDSERQAFGSGNDGDVVSDASVEATVRIDDGGSDLTDRFKYKVNALMGVFDPPAEQDNERVSGHILNAMVTFPVRYTFHVVGRGDSDSFVSLVRDLVEQATGDDQIVMQVTPRGNKFTKVLIEASVQSANMVTSVYEQLEALDQVVMKF